MKEKVKQLLCDVENLKTKNLEDCALPGNVYYLNDSEILCLERTNGESRYPYEMDGRNLWIHSTGHINSTESNLTIFRNSPRLQDESNLDVWGGIKMEDGWFPISITGISKQLFEPFKVERYLVYTKRAAYFIADTPKVTFALKTGITSGKAFIFNACAINKTDENIDTYIASYFNPLLMCAFNDDVWGGFKRFGKLHENGACTIERKPSPGENDPTNIAVFRKEIITDGEYTVERTASKAQFMGEPGRCMVNAKSLKDGKFQKYAYSVNTIDVAISSEIVKLNLKPQDEATVCFLMDVVHDMAVAEKLVGEKISVAEIEKDLLEQEERENKRLSGVTISFGKCKEERLNNVIFNKFLKNVQRQIDLCSFGKSYAGDMLGIRDVFQQLTAASVWNKDDVRRRIILCMNYIMSNGRAPRQFAVPAVEGAIPKFDIRQFIDQGLWIIETVHKYISKTGDYSILSEKCSYYEIIDEKKAQYKKSEIVDTVLDHLIKITDYLTSNIDARTNCLKILYGDWNDALNGLGVSMDGKSEFGTGCSVMATLQLYKLLKEMDEILTKVGGYDEKCKDLLKIRDEIAVGLENFAVQSDGDHRMLIHGWGDEGSYTIGSLCDTDGKKRYSVNPYSFWCISEMIKRDKSIKKDILKAYEMLDSKYGIKTFDQYFPEDMKGVGRIATLTPGTAENANTYVHATTFAIMALFIMGEGKLGWEQIMKALPLTHDEVSKTPFVMPNSYCYNEEFQIDGESFGDWYTGSGAVIYRCIYEYALGIRVNLDGVLIATSDYMPFDDVEVETSFKGKNVKFVYNNKNEGERKYFIDGVLQESQIDEISGHKTLFINNEDIKDGMVIEVID